MTKYYKKYTPEQIAEIKLTAVPENTEFRSMRADTLGEIIASEYLWMSTFSNKIAKRVPVKDGITPSYKNRKKIPNKIFFISNDDGLVQHSTLRADKETTLAIVNMVQSEFWNRFGVAYGDLSQEDESLEAIQHSFDVSIDTMGWTLVKAAKAADNDVDRSGDTAGERELTADKLLELLNVAEDVGYGDISSTGVLFLNAKRYGQLRLDAIVRDLDMSMIFRGEVVIMPSTASADGNYGGFLGHDEIYLRAAGDDVARQYDCEAEGKEILTEDASSHDHSFKLGVKALKRVSLAVVKAEKIFKMKMNASLKD